MTTREQIIAAAKEAGFPEWENTDDPEFLKVIEKLYVVAFQSGAASRDAEIQRLQMALADAEALELGTAEKCDQLRAHVNRLKEALGKHLTELMDIAVANGANSVSMPDEYVATALLLSSTPEQSLAEYRNKVIEDCTITIENCEPDEHGRLSIQEIAEAVSAMKEQP